MWVIQIFLAVAFGAAGATTLMGGAAVTHAMRGESTAVSTILAVLVIAVASFR